MDPFVIVSPHLDDAVLSCGQFMAGRPDTTVVTVFAGDPPSDVELTDFDRHSGFSDAAAAMRSRRAEDVAATSLLSANVMHLSFVDAQYRGLWEDVEVDEVVFQLRAALDQTGARGVLGPVGVVHPDHTVVADAVLQLVDDFDVWLYEELPGRVLWPDVVCSRFFDMRRRFDSWQEFIGDGPMARKAKAVSAYRSQAWALDRRCLFVPERFHRVVLSCA